MILALGGAAALAWANRFVLDDAFISLRYAEHLAEGHGLVWNPGEAVEGYTNFLWTVLVAAPFLLDLDPVLFSQVAGLACFVAMLEAARRLSERLLGPWWAGLLVVALLATNHTVSAYATSGLETAMQTMWLAVAAALVAGGYRGTLSTGRGVAVSVALAAAVLTRMDSAVLGVWIGLAALALAGALPSRRRRLAAVAALCVPFAVVVGVWLAWKVRTYGDILPNTYYAKVTADTPWKQGARYLWTFLRSYWLVPLPLVVLAAAPRLRGSPHRALLWPAAALLSWCTYLVHVGGDFMEFRFMVPAMPAVFLLAGALAVAWGRRPVIAAALTTWIVAGSVDHARTFRTTRGIESVDMLAAHLRHPSQDWIGVGRTLRQAFPEAEVRIATTAAGAIPFYSELPAVDMLGLTDPWIARKGRLFDAQIAHARIAPVRYLVARRVHLVLGQPWIKRPGPPERSHRDFRALRAFRVFGGAQAEDFPPQTSIVEIPMGPDRVLAAVYLTPHPAVERAIEEQGWRRFGIRAPAPDATL
ncbi:MAG: hypothetical protein ACQEXJ_02130 [Myxococcota bacterium]